MAYMNQEKKAKIAATLKQVMPKDWKYSLSVRNYSTIVMTIKSAPFDLVGMYNQNTQYKRDYLSLTLPYRLEENFNNSAVVAILKNAFAALNIGNFNNSDSQTDYFHVGHYVDIKIGSYDSAFINTSTATQAEAA